VELIQEINEQARVTQLRSPEKLPTREELKGFLEQKLGRVKMTGKDTHRNRRTITVELQRYDIPEVIDDTANRVLRAFGLEYVDLIPGDPGPHGQTNKFVIHGAELRDQPGIVSRKPRPGRRRKMQRKINPFDTNLSLRN